MGRGLIAVLLALAVGIARAETVRALQVAKPAPNSERRIALVIGNSAYKTSPLRNPVNDARAIAGALTETGFAVTLVEDGTQAGMRRAIRSFGDELARGGVGLFYYAGHGMQVRGKNFLIPVNADIQREDEVEDQAVDANLMLSKMDTAKNALNIMILDACRNNPFQRSFRSVAQGLAQMDAPSGTLIAFATAPGSVAADGEGENGLYTKHLLEQIRKPGTPVEQLFKQVRNGVMADTRDRQVPWESSSLRGDFFFLVRPPGMQAEEKKREQQQAIDRAVGDALKTEQERAARERAELEERMKRLIADMLAKQRSDLEAELKARGATSVAAAKPAPAPAPAAKQPAPARPAPSAAATPQTPPPPIASAAPSAAAARGRLPRVGDRWEYGSRRLSEPERLLRPTFVVTAALGREIVTRLLGSGGTGREWVHTPGPYFVGQGPFWVFSPFIGAFGELREGAVWRDFDYQNVGVCSHGAACDIRARVAGRERVTVAAGTFDAWKVVVDYYGPGFTQVFTFWYADEAKTFVKHTVRGIRIDLEWDIELLSYKLN